MSGIGNAAWDERPHDLGEVTSRLVEYQLATSSAPERPNRGKRPGSQAYLPFISFRILRVMRSKVVPFAGAGDAGGRSWPYRSTLDSRTREGQWESNLSGWTEGFSWK